MTVSFGSSMYSVSEGASVSVTVELSAALNSAVTVQITAAGTASAQDYTLPDPLEVVFAANETSKTITVWATDDDVDDDNESVVLSLDPPSGLSTGTPGSTTITVVDSDRAALVVAPVAVAVVESGASGSYAVRLATEPSADVTVVVTGYLGTDVSLSSSLLTFTDSDWSVVQTVTVDGATDADASDDVVVLVHTASSDDSDYGGLTAQVAVTVVERAGDYDLDNDALIDVGNLAQLNAVRWDLDGDGSPDRASMVSGYGAAFPAAAADMGCSTATALVVVAVDCLGYELVSDLDFGVDRVAVEGLEEGPTAGAPGSGWVPVGTSIDRFDAVFDGGGFTVSNLFIDRTTDNVGLFGYLGGSAVVRDVGLLGVDVTTNGISVGALVGLNLGGSVTGSYAIGDVVGHRSVRSLAG